MVDGEGNMGAGHGAAIYAGGGARAGLDEAVFW